jgi:hypothetical protein
MFKLERHTIFEKAGVQHRYALRICFGPIFGKAQRSEPQLENKSHNASRTNLNTHAGNGWSACIRTSLIYGGSSKCDRHVPTRTQVGRRPGGAPGCTGETTSNTTFGFRAVARKPLEPRHVLNPIMVRAFRTPGKPRATDLAGSWGRLLSTSE